jgi:hypothetical protein
MSLWNILDKVIDSSDTGKLRCYMLVEDE